MTKEHIWSDWLKNTGVPPQGYRTEHGWRITSEPGKLPFTLDKLTKKQGPVHRRQAKVVCEPCNGGWMSDMVQAAKPFVAKIISHYPVTLDETGQRAVANWISLSSMVACQKIKNKNKLRKGNYVKFYENKKLPDNWTVYIGTCDRTDFSGFNPAILSLSFPSGEADTPKLNIYTFAHIVGGLFAAVNVVDAEPYSITIERNVFAPYLTKIWPVVEPEIFLPKPAPIRIPGPFLAGTRANELANRFPSAVFASLRAKGVIE